MIAVSLYILLLRVEFSHTPTTLSIRVNHPKSARKNRSGDAGAIFGGQLRRGVAFSLYYADPGTVPGAKYGSLGRRRGEGYSLATLKEKTRKSSGRTFGGCQGDEVFAGAFM